MRQPSKKPASLVTIKRAARKCRDCPLWVTGTQTVFGEGPESARLMLVGEQPGDQEDIQGRPFVGPAGKLLDKALQTAGLDRNEVYVTNAVKHFKYELRGKRRIHKSPAQREILACHQWLEREIVRVQPKLIVTLGATAARAIFGRATAIQANRGRVQSIVVSGVETKVDVLVTVHPAFLLRVPSEDRDSATAQFIDDLKVAAAALKRG
jgi:uracil-DNA glycosylase family protein